MICTHRGRIACECGYALTSVLLLIVILSFLVVSILTLQQGRRLLALSDVARMKAELASQSGVARMMNDCRSLNSASQTREYSFTDGSQASAELQPWGTFLSIRSTGRYGRITRSHTAIVAEKPPPVFENALVFCNPTNQLVFAGSASITGNVVVGQPGVTTGSLPNHRAPPRIPISGTTKRELRPQLPEFNTSSLQNEVRRYDRLLRGVEYTQSLSGRLDLSSIDDTTSSFVFSGDMVIHGSIIRRERPVAFAFVGKVSIEPHTSIRGLVAIISSGTIRIENGVESEHTIFYSKKSVDVSNGADLIGQFIAPRITVGERVNLRYPSAIVSMGTPSDSQRIDIKSNAIVRGFVGLVGGQSTRLSEKLIVVEPGSRIVGAVYSGNMLTLDGDVVGTVLTRNLYFYDAPTSYQGWMRMGRIDRMGLPEAYLAPVGFSHEARLTVLDWL